MTRAAGGEDAGHVRGVPGGQEQRRHRGHRAVREHHQVQVIFYIVCRTSEALVVIDISCPSYLPIITIDSLNCAAAVLTSDESITHGGISSLQ